MNKLASILLYSAATIVSVTGAAQSVMAQTVPKDQLFVCPTWSATVAGTGQAACDACIKQLNNDAPGLKACSQECKQACPVGHTCGVSENNPPNLPYCNTIDSETVCFQPGAYCSDKTVASGLPPDTDTSYSGTGGSF